MRDKPISILSTRPLDEALIQKAASQNITIETADFIHIKNLVTPEVAEQIAALANRPATVVFTSMNAVEIVMDAIPADSIVPDWKIYCLGGATFTLVKKYWAYDSIKFTAKNASELAIQIANDKITELTFFCGNKRREELPKILKTARVVVKELVVYETVETPAKIHKTYNAILFFSPSAVQSFFSDNQISAGTSLFAIGNTTAKAIKEFSANEIIVSEFPAKDQLVDKAIKYFSET